MEISVKTAGLSTDWETGELIMSFKSNCVAQIIQEYERLKDLPKLRLKVVKWTDKRSLDANAYFHVLVGKIAEALTISKAKAKNILICKYGQPVRFDDGEFAFYKTNAPIEFILEQEEPHFIFVQTTPDGMNMFKQYRGSHTYDSKEMSALIDGTVADAKELGIETMTPDELLRMKNAWKH